MEQVIQLRAIASAVVFSFIGLLLFLFSLYLFDKLTPGNFWKEILEENNTALAIMVGAVAIGLSVIVAAAIHG